MTAILGLNMHHADSAACLLLDGHLVGAVAEERLGSRNKHTSEFPERAIKHLLKDNGVNLSDIDYIAVARKPSANRLAKISWSLNNVDKALAAFTTAKKRSGDSMRSLSELYKILGVPKKFQRFKIVEVEHHVAHIASSYFSSPFEKATAGFSYDASGDFVSAMLAKCEGLDIQVKRKVFLPDSLGFFYTAICQFIGFDNFGEEYKVMGLAPYGDDVYKKEMNELIRPINDFGFKLNRQYFQMHSGGKSGEMNNRNRIKMGTLYTEKLQELFGKTCERNEFSERQKNIAKSAQTRFEEITVSCVDQAMELTNANNLVTAGGAALNGVANAKILRHCRVDKAFIHPAAGDDGTAVGAALYLSHTVLKNSERKVLESAALGPKYNRAEILGAINEKKLDFIEFDDDQSAVRQAATDLSKNRIVGWFHGRSEWGPRALGHRSILANPGCAEMKDLLNKKIKKRESFRPFAPSVLNEDVARYFDQAIPSPFMMHVIKFKKEYAECFPAVTHVDGTGRIQSVTRESNLRYHTLISEFKKLTGIGMVLNTSFNENEPIVDTPEQALACFLRTDMDVICLENFWITK